MHHGLHRVWGNRNCLSELFLGVAGWAKQTLEPRFEGRQKTTSAGSLCRGHRWLCDGDGWGIEFLQLPVEVLEEITSHLLRRHVDQALSDLRDLSADGRVCFVVQNACARRGRFNPYRRRTLAVTRRAALTFKIDPVRGGGEQIRQLQFALELGFDGSDRGGDEDLEVLWRRLREGITAWNGLLEYIDVVECIPGLLLRYGQRLLVRYLHRDEIASVNWWLVEAASHGLSERFQRLLNDACLRLNRRAFLFEPSYLE